MDNLAENRVREGYCKGFDHSKKASSGANPMKVLLERKKLAKASR